MSATFYSSRNPSVKGNLKDAVLTGLAPDGGLFMPTEIPRLDKKIIDALSDISLQEIGIAVSAAFFSDDIPENNIRDIIETAISFPAPLVELNNKIASLELFHGPSMAFKDFGARFMAQLMSWLIRNDDDPLHILVATSGDTGGAVALGFLNVPGIKVTILYPKGRVTALQELQLTTNGGNIQALEVVGSFDDCQDMVKLAFQDEELRAKYRLTSANSINISRLIPQSFYYFHGLTQLYSQNPDVSSQSVSFSIPSGNFGNLTAGVMAKLMGAPINHFIAATNVNDVVPRYLESGEYAPKDSIRTISNAMDVGNPSNYERLKILFKNDVEEFKKHLIGFRYTDSETEESVKECWEKYQYIADPHGAIGYRAAKDYLQNLNDNENIIFLETAHPIKFKDDVERVIGTSIPEPKGVSELAKREKQSTLIPPTLEALRASLS